MVAYQLTCGLVDVRLAPMLVEPGSNLVLVIFLTDADRFEFVLHFVTSGG